MIKHILKFLWNQKIKYCSIFIEQVLVTIVLMLCIVSIATSVKKYNDPGLLDTSHTVMFGFMIPRTATMHYDANELAQNMTAVSSNLKLQPYVKSITKSMFLAPYLRPGENYFSDSVMIDEKKTYSMLKFADPSGSDVFNPIMKEGRWLDMETLEDGSFQAVVTQQFVNEAGWTTQVVGRKFHLYSRTYTIVGVIEGAKQQPFEPSPASIILPIEIYGNSFYIENIAKINGNEKGAFFNEFYKEFKKYIPHPEIEPVITDMDVWKQMSMLSVLTSILMQSIPTFFLLIFSFIGTFGLFWLQAKKRTKEFALRIALGSTSKELVGFVITESVIITLLAIIPALLLSLFIYDLDRIHIVAIFITFLVMIIFSIFSSWYPAWKVSKINPAEVLQYE